MFPIRCSRFGIVLLALLSLAMAWTAQADSPATKPADASDRPLSRTAQLRRDAACIQASIQSVGDWEACSKLLDPWRAGLAERLRNAPKPRRGQSFIASDAPLTGQPGWLLSARRAKQLLHDAASPSTDQLGLRRQKLFYQAALAFHRHLADQGIDLLVVPVPDKSDVYPHHLAKLPDSAPTVMLQSKRVYLELIRAGVEVVDLEPAFGAAARQADDGAPLYMRRDTHWAPTAARLAAREVARRLARYGSIVAAGKGDPQFRVKEGLTVRHLGDLEINARRAGLKPQHPHEQYRLPGIVETNGKPVWRAKSSPVLVLGDSYSVFPYDGSHSFWGYLSAELSLRTACVDRPGGAAHLAHRFDDLPARQRRDARVVVWLFTNCSIYEQDFRPPRKARQSEQPSLTAEITLTDAPPAIDPDKLAYADALLARTARIDRVIEGKSPGQDVLVVLPAVTDRKLLPAARLGKGRKLRVQLRWAIPTGQAAWMLIDETEAYELHPWFVADARPLEAD